MWLLSFYYLNGYRRFDQFSPTTGQCIPHLLDENGDLEFQSMELLSHLDRVVAKLNSMDVLPFVAGNETTLERIRERSMAQILLDASINPDSINYTIKRQFNYLYASLGSCGLQGYLKDHPTVGLSTDLEVVHPRELFPFPSLGQDYTKVRGLMRQRMLPLTFLTDLFGNRIKANKDKMHWYEYIPGENVGMFENGMDTAAPGLIINQGAGTATGGEPGQDAIGWAKTRETWLDGTKGTCSRYIITCGDYLIHDQDLSNKEAYCPIGFSRFMDCGSFHGVGMFDLLYGINRQMEFLLKSLFNNIRNADRYGIVVLPSGAYNERNALKDATNGLKVLSVAPEPLAEGFNPFTIAPFNSGDVPGRVAQFAKNLMDGISPIQDLANEKGRIDSMGGLQFLDEKLNEPMTNPTIGVASAWGTMYRSLCCRISDQVKISPRPIPVTRLTLDLAGAVIDPKEATVSFPDNPLPDVSRLSFSIKEASPKSKVARKEEAVSLLEKGVTDPDAFKIFALQEGLDFAMWLGEEQPAYETAVRNCLIAFGDGETPGEIIVTPYTSRPDIQARIVMSFMGSPRIAHASPDVHDALADLLDFLKQMQGLAPIQGLTPAPDEFAMQPPAMMGPGMPMPGMPPGMPPPMSPGMPEPGMMSSPPPQPQPV